MKHINKLLFKVHSTLAIVTFLPLLVVCLSGSFLVFKHEIDRMLINELVVVTPHREPLPRDALLGIVNSAHKGYEVVGWTWHLDPGRADLIYLIKTGTSDWWYLYLNQYTGELLSEPKPHGHYFTDWLLELHFNLLLDDAGMVVTMLLGLFLMVLGVSGCILHRKFWKNFLTLRWNSRLVVYLSDLHKMVGIVSSPILLLLAFTGIWWNVVAVLHEVEEHSDGKEHHIMTQRLYDHSISIDGLVQEAEASIPGFQPTYLTLPWEPGVEFSLWGSVPTNNFLVSEYASVATFSASTGEPISTFDIRTATTGAVILDSYRKLHFGNFAGLASKVLWSIIGATPLLLAMTGMVLWFKRRSKRKRFKTQQPRGLDASLPNLPSFERATKQ